MAGGGGGQTGFGVMWWRRGGRGVGRGGAVLWVYGCDEGEVVERDRRREWWPDLARWWSDLSFFFQFLIYFFLVECKRREEDAVVLC